MHHVKFSLIVPVYNVENYLERCIDSLYHQSYTNFEVICVNDGSTDNSSRVLERLSVKYPGLIVVQQENKGLGEARNAGVPHAHGEYIWFIDSDDWIESDALETLDRFIKQEEYPDIVLFDFFKVIDGVKQTLPHIRNYMEQRLPQEAYLQLLLSHQAHYFGCGKVFKTSTYIKSRFRFPVGFYEDVALITFYKNSVKSIGYLHKELYNYYIRNNSIMRTYDNRILDVFDRFTEIKATLYEPKWEKQLAAFFYTFCITKKRQARMAEDKSVLDLFWKYYDDYRKGYHYLSKHCFFNPYMTLGTKIKIMFHLILSR